MRWMEGKALSYSHMPTTVSHSLEANYLTTERKFKSKRQDLMKNLKMKKK